MRVIRERKPLSLAPIAVLVGLLACSAGAFGDRAGYNGPTRTLEAAFKIAQLERKSSEDGCYPPATPLSAAIREAGVRVGVAANFKVIRKRNVVFVVKQGATCGQLRMALLAKEGLYVLDAAGGSLELVGKGKGNDGSRDQEAGGGGPLRALTTTTKTFQLTQANEVQRLTILCPSKSFPLGGGMVNIPAPGPDGEGIYPHSYERLGVQRGWHINPVLVDPSLGQTTPRSVTLQVVCGRGLVATSSPHKTVFVKPGQTKTAIARCPKGAYLVSGGFQRTNFRTPDGSYVTESRAIGANAWRVSGSAFGADGGELTAIAYCDRSKRPLATEVSASTTLAAGQLATATTPRCPKGRKLAFGGFSANGSVQALFAGGYFNANGTWSATAFGYFGPAPSLTAYGYCLRPGV
jgi:hypothetical protein